MRATRPIAAAGSSGHTGPAQYQARSWSSADAHRQQRRGCGRKNPKLDFRAAELRSFFRQDQVTGQRQFESTAQTLSADGSNRRRRRFSDSPQQRMKPGERPRNLFREVLLNTGPKTEVGAFAGEHDGLEVPPRRELIEGRLQLGHHRLIDDIGLGRGKNDTGHLPFVFKFHANSHTHSVFRGACRLRRPGGNFLD